MIPTTGSSSTQEALPNIFIYSIPDDTKTTKDDTDFVDFCGVSNGKAICFELKSTENKTSFPFANIKKSQINNFTPKISREGRKDKFQN